MVSYRSLLTTGLDRREEGDAELINIFGAALDTSVSA